MLGSTLACWFCDHSDDGFILVKSY